MSSWQDHPRSRGVYSCDVPPAAACAGSSPLARGLLPGGGSWSFARRIIPARAGFTIVIMIVAAEYWDHPRSRGVYFAAVASWIGWLGSSPLARGLRAQPSTKWWHVRIIPARAGFTRGRENKLTRQQGSSPLARGLLGGTRRPRRRLGDHPRSRGVYVGGLLSAGPPSGSSPLARGLPAERSAPFPTRGIIPARAGFTVNGPWDDIVNRDHPRSRGVYRLSIAISTSDLGSSPLARGLPAWPPESRSMRRIIPARAGFTTMTFGP